MHPQGSSRRLFFRHACCTTLGVAGAATLPAFAAEGSKTSLSPDQALTKPKQGSADFLADKVSPAPRDHKRRL